MEDFVFCPACGKKLPASASFCSGCGKKLEKKTNEVYCKNCGARLTPDAAFCPECGTAAKPSTETVGRYGKVGYSDVINSPEFTDGVKKQKKIGSGCAIALFVAPVIIAPICSLFSDSLNFGTGLLIGLAISAVMMLISFFATRKERTMPSFDGVVSERYEKRVLAYEDREDRDNDRWERHYFIVIRKDDGTTHKIEEKRPFTYDYMKVGDRIRYHGKMGLSFPYEKYDKSQDDYVICAFCRKRAPIADDRCPKCKKPLLK